MSLTANGCTITRATTGDTQAAEVWSNPPGLRHLGYHGVTTVEGGAVAFVNLSMQEDVVLPANDRPQAILSLQIEAQVPASGCSRCTIQIGDGLAWRGPPIETVFVADGRAYRPSLPAAEIDFCGN